MYVVRALAVLRAPVPALADFITVAVYAHACLPS